MGKESKADEITEANREVSRPGKKRDHGTFAADTLPTAMGAITSGKPKKGETERALKRATKTRP